MGINKILNNNLEVIVLAVFVLILLLPVGYSAARSVFSQETQDSQSFIDKPDEKYGECVKDSAYMRLHHMEFLKEIRDEVVREGVSEGKRKSRNMGLNSCRKCHTSRDRFCEKCHNAMNVQLDCYGCHYYPE